MFKDVVAVEPVGDYRLHLRFEDGVEGEVDVAAIIPFEGAIAELRDPDIFAAVAVNPELGTIGCQMGPILTPTCSMRWSRAARRPTCGVTGPTRPRHRDHQCRVEPDR